ncbi:hypothetical protein [Gordonibacter massiliensis (ex Traore et al. 2017)]|uniref:Uncharacterized protein n=1 Tax=Gordonibacter massiliensis (ex Traore et al. 2017) TaxID=1841863 RepID=A0A842JE26_9ACTN|nr:hypothetical protein [Gordonibacter massiliensis (ex Traore et al. 2017)]MBC2888135.1 hypothetical protein [Gordonibacter massiliensis (ex Traore et al. 2017)]
MDIQTIVDQVVGALREAPEKVQEIMADPAGAVEQITGHRLEEGDLASVAQGVLAKIAEEGGDLQEKLAGLGDSIGDKVSSLIGDNDMFSNLLDSIFKK